jgi:NMD protein affecting ribosome stability and mRNA decay
MRAWSKQVAYEDRHRAAGICTRCTRRRDPRSKNMCAECLAIARRNNRRHQPREGK